MGFFVTLRALTNKELRRCLTEDTALTDEAQSVFAKIKPDTATVSDLKILERALRRAVSGQLSTRDWQERQYVASSTPATALIVRHGDRDRLPKPLIEDLDAIAKDGHSVATERLIGLFAEASQRKTLLRDWLAERPSWLPEDARVEGWLAHLAFYGGNSQLGAEWSERALAAGAVPRAYWKVRIAWTYGDGQDPASSLSEVLDSPIAAAVLSAKPLDERISAVEDWVPLYNAEEEARADILIQLMTENGRAAEAFQMGRTLFEQQGFATCGLSALQAHRACDPVTVPGLLEARQLAVAVRDVQRATGVPSLGAVRACVRLSTLLGDADMAMRMTLPLPEGEATEQEASSARIVSERILLLLSDGALDEAASLVSPATPEPIRLQLAAYEAEADGDAAGASELLGRAIDETEDWSEKAELAYNLAARGVKHPFVEEMRPNNERIAGEIDLLVNVFNHVPGALDKLKSEALDSPRSAHMLARHYTKEGDRTALLQIVEHIARHWGAPRDRLQAGIMRYQRGDYDKAMEHAAHAANTSVRSIDGTARQALQLQYACAEKLRDWDAAVTAATSLVDTAPSDPDGLWALVHAYHRAGDDERAFECWRQSSACRAPRSPYEAGLWLHLYQLNGSAMAPLSEAVALGQQFSDDEQVRRLVIGVALLAPVAEPDVKIDASRMVDEFTADFPGTSLPIQKVVLPDGDDSDGRAILDALAEALGGPREPNDLDRQVTNGTIPLGLAVLVMHRNFAESIVVQRRHARFAGTLRPAPNTESIQRARTTGVAIDTTALLTLASLPAAAVDSLRSVVPHWMSAVSQIRDVHESTRGMRGTKGHFHPGTPSSAPMFIEVDEQESAERARILTFMMESLKFAERADPPAIVRPDFSLDDLRGPWSGAMERAAAAGVPMWCDDARTRMLAGELGVESFGTPELVAFMRSEQLLDTDLADAIEAAMVHGYVVGVPYSRAVYELARTLDGGRVGGTAVAILHGGNAHLREKIELISDAMAGSASSDPETLKNWASVLTQLLIGATGDEGATTNVGIVVLKVLGSDWATGHSVPFALEGVRSAAADRWYPALRYGATTAWRLFQGVLPAGIAADYLNGLTRGLAEEERRMVLEIILRPIESSGGAKVQP